MKKHWLHLLPVMFIMLLPAACRQQPFPNTRALHNPMLYSRTVKHLTDVLVHDIFSPPVKPYVRRHSLSPGNRERNCAAPAGRGAVNTTAEDGAVSA